MVVHEASKAQLARFAGQNAAFRIGVQPRNVDTAACFAAAALELCATLASTSATATGAPARPCQFLVASDDSADAVAQCAKALQQRGTVLVVPGRHQVAAGKGGGVSAIERVRADTLTRFVEWHVMTQARARVVVRNGN